MYKFSQDHLELFFGAIRATGGFNNNPTAEQFTAAYKRLLMRCHITPNNNGNCIMQDETSMLVAFDDTIDVPEIQDNLSLSTASVVRKYDLENVQPVSHDYIHTSFGSRLSEFKESAISYIAGYVVKMAKKKIVCSTCAESLGSATWLDKSEFMVLKDRGGLVKPSSSVQIICRETEKCFQRMLGVTNGNLPQGLLCVTL